MIDYTKYNIQTSQAVATDQGLRQYMLRVFNFMAAALAITGLVAYIVPQSPALLSLFYTTNEMGMVTGQSGLGILITFAPLIFVIVFNMNLARMSSSTAQMLLMLFSVLMGLSLSYIFITYTDASIARAFFVSAALFLSMSIYGYTTKKDLTGMGSFLFMGLIGVVIAGLVNIFMQSPMIYFVTSAIAVIIFTGLTAYDVQQLVGFYYRAPDQESKNKMAVVGALSLYMNFINIFLSLLRLFGDRR